MKKAFNRILRRTEEKLTTTEKTVLEPQLARKVEKATVLRDITQKMVSTIEVMTGQAKSTNEPHLEQLGNQMIHAGTELGVSSPHGACLIKVGEYERNLGKSQRVFYNKCIDEYLTPMKMFVDGDMKALVREISTLEKKRLDLDVSKKNQRKANPQNVSPQILNAVAERQAAYDRQKEVVELLANRIEQDEPKYVALLHKFVALQRDYYGQCSHAMQQLQEDLGKTTPVPK